ncbi:MAG: DUF4390 domain-containing protein [Steroidobacteraceae bacterium]
MGWRHTGLACCAALICAAAPATARAQDEGRFEVRNAYVELAGDRWHLDVRLDLALAEAAQQAFAGGVPLVLELEIEASVARRFLPAEAVVEMTRRWELAYDAISQHYIVTDRESGEQVSHVSQQDALDAFARLSGIVIADTRTLPPDGRFGMRVRAMVEIGDLPAAIRILLFWRSWSRSTDWYEWSVRP